jgi:hypothetical protein
MSWLITGIGTTYLFVELDAFTEAAVELDTADESTLAFLARGFFLVSSSSILVAGSAAGLVTTVGAVTTPDTIFWIVAN